MSAETAAIIDQDVLAETDDTLSQESKVEDGKEPEETLAERQAAAQLQLEYATGRTLRVKQTFHSQLIIGRDGSKKMYFNGKETTVAGGLDEDGIPKIESIAASAHQFAVYEDSLTASVIESDYVDLEGNRYINLQLFSFEAGEFSEKYVDFVENVDSTDGLSHRENVEEAVPKPSPIEPKKIGFWEAFFRVEYQAVPVAAETSVPELARLFDLFPLDVRVVDNQEATEAPLAAALDRLEKMPEGEIVLAGEAATVQSPDIPYTDVTVIRKENIGAETLLSFEFREVPSPTEVQLLTNPQWEATSHAIDRNNGEEPAPEVGSPTVIARPNVISLDTVVTFETTLLRESRVPVLPVPPDQEKQGIKQMNQVESLAIPLGPEPPQDLPLVFEEQLVAPALARNTTPENAQAELQSVPASVVEIAASSVVSIVSPDRGQESAEEIAGMNTVAFKEGPIDFITRPMAASQAIPTVPETVVGYRESQPVQSTADNGEAGLKSPFAEVVLEATEETTRMTAAPEALSVGNETVQPPVIQATELPVADAVLESHLIAAEARESLARPAIISNDQVAVLDIPSTPFETAPRSVPAFEETAATSVQSTEPNDRVQEAVVVSQQQFITTRGQRSAREQRIPAMVNLVTQAITKPTTVSEEVSIQNAAVLRRPAVDVDEEDDATSSTTAVSNRATTQRRVSAA